jgi:hypothetical protein
VVRPAEGGDRFNLARGGALQRESSGRGASSKGQAIETAKVPDF